MMATRTLILLLLIGLASGQLQENERLEEYHKRNYTWPLSTYHPNTLGWSSLLGYRLNQVSEMEDSGKRYEGFYQTIKSAMVLPNYTEFGFGLAKAPDDLTRDLQVAIAEGLPTAGHEPSDGGVITKTPRFIKRPDLLRRILTELHPYAEEWVGMPLIAHQAYGFRLYSNESQLFMHVDRTQTHIISFILHIDSSDDSEPWPIFIEDFEGNTHEVVLTPGSMLFYESAKCFHGRPRPFKGDWYVSVFVHYTPLDWEATKMEFETHYAVPPLWANTHTGPKQYRTLEMIETAMKEPDCPDDWCPTQNAIQWTNVTAQHGYWITPKFERVPYHPAARPTTEEL